MFYHIFIDVSLERPLPTKKLLRWGALVNIVLLIPRNYSNNKTALHVQVSVCMFINKTRCMIDGENKLYPTVQYKAVFLSRVSGGNINHGSKAQVVCTCHHNPEIKIWPYNMYSLGVFYIILYMWDVLPTKEPGSKGKL